MKALQYIFIIISIALTSCGKQAEKETFYIREGYTGPVAIVFDQKNGLAKEYKEDTRIYRIPESGVLYSKFSGVDGLLNQKFYYVNSSGEIASEIPVLFMPIISTTKFDSSRVYAMVGVDGSFEKNTGDVEYIYFSIGSAVKSDSLKGEGYKLMERVRESYPEQIR
jgi:hypothetical protein